MPNSYQVYKWEKQGRVDMAGCTVKAKKITFLIVYCKSGWYRGKYPLVPMGARGFYYYIYLYYNHGGIKFIWITKTH